MKPNAYQMIKNNDIESIKKYINNGYDINMSDACDDGILNKACYHGRIEIAKLLIDHPKCDINVKCYYKSTPLMNACCQNHIEIVKMLINHPDCDINAQSIEGKTGLIYACENGNLEIIKLLLSSKKCDINFQNIKGSTCLHYAAKFSDMIEIEEGKWQLIYDNVEMVDLLIKHGANVNIVNKHGQTCLYKACKNRNNLIAKRLINEGCNVDMQATGKECYIGWTSLMIALCQGTNKTVDVLMEAKCDINIINKEGRTALFMACEREKLYTINRLISAGCDINIQDNSGDTPLMNQCHANFYHDVINLLIKSGCNIDLVNKKGETGLIIACMNGCRDIIMLLIKSYCLLNIENSKGETYLKYIDFKDYENYLFNDMKMREVNNTILDAGLIGSCIRYIKENIEKFNRKHLLALPQDVRKYLKYVIKN